MPQLVQSPPVVHQQATNLVLGGLHPGTVPCGRAPGNNDDLLGRSVTRNSIFSQTRRYKFLMIRRRAFDMHRRSHETPL